jgi:hypothetical protein
MARYRGRILALTGVAALSLAAGCGVSDTASPVDEGDAAVAAPDSLSSQIRTPPDANTALSPADLVTKFFTAAVGAEYSQPDAINRLKSFMAKDSQQAWQPGQELSVVRILGSSPSGTGSTFRQDVSYKVIGTMSSDGTITPRSQARQPFPFRIVSQGGGWRLENAPQDLMISEAALRDYYKAEPIYFWDLKKKTLVPDLRYLPLTMPTDLRPNQIVKWLIGGPSPMVKPAVVVFRAGVELRNTRVTDSLVVDLSSGAATDNIDDQQKLLYQLRWSLLPYWDKKVKLAIEGQVKKDVDTDSDIYRGFNLAAPDPAAELFSVDDKGKVVTKSSSAPDLQSLLAAKANANVKYAAISVDHRLAAYVQEKAGARSLTVVTAGSGDQGPQETLVKLPSHADIGRPVWITGQDQLLVPVGGQLYLVSVRGAKALDITPAGLGDIRSVSVSPDARRLAFVAGTRAYVAALKVDGASVGLGSEITPMIPDRLTANAVAWTSETRLLVAGGDQGNGKMFLVTADGILAVDESPRTSDGRPAEQTLTDMVAFRENGEAVAQSTSGAVFFAFKDGRTQYEPTLKSPFYAS